MTAPRFAAALSQHPVASHAVGEVAGEVLDAFAGDEPDLLVLFVSPHFVGAMDDLTFALADLLEPRVMLGATMVGVVGGSREVEDAPAVAVFAVSCPDATLTPVALDLERTPDGAAITGWPDLDGDPSTLLLLADPFSFPLDSFLARLRDDRPELQVIGGAASAARGPGGNRLVLDGRVVTTGAVGVFVDGLPVRAVVSQGCRPVGAPYVITRGEGNRIYELAGRSGIDRVQDTAADVSEEDRVPHARRPAPRDRGRRAPRRLRARRLPRAQRARRRSRHRRARRRRRHHGRPDGAVPRARRGRGRRGPARDARR